MIGIGIDTGGTCTDAVIYDFDKREILASGKALTTKQNLEIGIANALGGGSRVGVLNLLVCTVLMYGLGRIRGKKEELEKERQLRE